MHFAMRLRLNGIPGKSGSKTDKRYRGVSVLLRRVLGWGYAGAAWRIFGCDLSHQGETALFRNLEPPVSALFSFARVYGCSRQRHRGYEALKRSGSLGSPDARTVDDKLKRRSL